MMARRSLANRHRAVPVSQIGAVLAQATAREMHERRRLRRVLFREWLRSNFKTYAVQVALVGGACAVGWQAAPVVASAMVVGAKRLYNYAISPASVPVEEFF